jgi:release factor glutamine methyltransferase
MTINELLEWAKSQLPHADNPLLEAQVLLAHALNCERIYLYTWPNKEVSKTQQTQFEALISRRIAKEPFAYILGYKEFWSLKLKVSPDTLIPRWDTELLVQTALAKLPKEQPLRILDLGTGCGAIACALASERHHWQIVASDVSAKALEIAQENAECHQLKNIRLVQSNWFANLAGERFNAILSNPPYIRENDLHLSQGDLPAEPLLALTAGPQGLESFKLILSQAQQHLNSNGFLAFEHGFDQGESVRELLTSFRYTQVETIRDHSGNERVTIGFLND